MVIGHSIVVETINWFFNSCDSNVPFGILPTVDNYDRCCYVYSGSK